ncbi:aminotransferase class I/II-fold pyridoxal phosphate-dependent enzyme [Paracoccus aestuariivivens]|uniref:Aminotransferase class I/II-fold pyridoxal phosphate-dependent enzyme n=1 Tax=Paracoccus aestuariivivens TaxID=1820333 RepID=A0A6L6JJN2_9RHOB|nr:aminotransferase class I/II-fold pyridoxal phosphate-dependent enzyme [Paracoccus aestuariivivens]MTH80051.1 aminotransferase class I/II-fold pyridoxal phosphate-dependent enzyme [Paracoccus aestuariivivens]
MALPERFSNLPEYAFPRLRTLLAGISPAANPVVMTIGEPRHAVPEFTGRIMAESIHEFGKYPSNEGVPELLAAISGWIGRRHGIEVEPARITTVNGTREGLFNAALALCPEQKNGTQAAILIPNPFYQVYAVAAAAVGAEPVFVPATAETGFMPQFDQVAPEILDRVAITYLCSPANPQGAVASEDYLEKLVALAERHDFLIFSDECYSEIWRDAPPAGALAVATRMGLADRVVMFNSLSKRSNLPGLRSGFAAGGQAQIAQLRRLRSYSGAPLPLPVQRVSTAAWADETHVEENRALYHAKYAVADRILGNMPGYQSPEGGFFLWLRVPEQVGTGEDAAKKLWSEAGIQVLPGAYLSRDTAEGNPGRDYIRVALVDPVDPTEAALKRLKNCLYQGG